MLFRGSGLDFSMEYVIPAKAGIQTVGLSLDSYFRRNDW